MNYRTMVEYHKRVNADLTVGALRVDRHAAQQFGVMQVDQKDRIVGFREKPERPKTIPGDERHCLASMGIYVFTARFLFEQLCREATDPDSAHDFGRNIIPSIIDSHRIYAFPFRDENRKGDAYWRDVGTLDAYYDANMDLVAIDPQLNMYDSVVADTNLSADSASPKFVFGASAAASGRDAPSTASCAKALSCRAGAWNAVSRAARASQQLCVCPGFQLSSRAWISDGTPRSGAPSSTRESGSRRAWRSVTTSTRTGERGFTVSQGGVVVIAKAEGVEQLLESGMVA